jgi:hypothetical protein
MSSLSELSHGRLWILSALVAGSQLYGQSQSTEERCRAAATVLLDAVKGQEASPPGWQGAVVGSVQAMKSPQQDWYLCSMARGDTEAGYIMVAQRDGQMSPVMFSGSVLSKEFGATLSLPPDWVPLAAPRRLQTAPEVLMIAPIDEELRTWPNKTGQITTGPMACCLASVLLSLQTSNESFPPLFGNMDKNEYWRRAKPFLGPKAGVAASRWETRYGFLPDLASIQRHRQRQEALVQLLREADLLVEARPSSLHGPSLDADLPSTAQSDSSRRPTLSGYAHKDLVKSFEVIAPPFQESLMGRITPFERFLALKEEQQLAEPGWIALPQGMCIAHLLEQGYVRRGASLEAVLARFARTRGFAVAVVYKSVSQVLAGELPCLLVGPNRQAAVLLALCEDGPGWGLVCVPETVQLLRKTPSGWEPYTTPAPAATLPAPASIDDRINAMLTNTTVVIAPDGRAPQSLDRGAHVVAIECLEGSWKAVPLTAWKALDNWELDKTD